MAANGKSEPHFLKWLQMAKVRQTSKNGFKW